MPRCMPRRFVLGWWQAGGWWDTITRPGDWPCFYLAAYRESLVSTNHMHRCGQIASVGVVRVSPAGRRRTVCALRAAVARYHIDTRVLLP